MLLFFFLLFLVFMGSSPSEFSSTQFGKYKTFVLLEKSLFNGFSTGRTFNRNLIQVQKGKSILCVNFKLNKENEL